MTSTPIDALDLDRLPPVAQRFLRYVQIDTQSDPDSETTPSTDKQKDLGRLLVSELTALGLDDAQMDRYGYVFATLPSTLPAEVAEATPTVALLAHVDTSPDAPGANVRPVVHFAYDGQPLALPGDPSVVLDPADRPDLARHIGQDLITSDGTTLLGSDDKAGVAVLMQLAADLLGSEAPRPRVRLCFTVDEEIGRGVDALDLERLGAQVAYTIDGSDIDTIAIETFNAVKATLRVTGVMVHPGYAKDVMINAVRILAGVIAALPDDEAPETTEGRAGYIHPHRLAAGTATTAEVELILRDFTDHGMARRRRLLEVLVEAARTRHPRATIDLTFEEQYRNMRSYIEATDARAASFAFAAAETMGIQLTQELVRGGTDGARLSERGLPTPNIFNGGHDYHSRFEWNTVQNLERSLAYVKALLQHWGEHGAGHDA